MKTPTPFESVASTKNWAELVAMLLPTADYCTISFLQ